MKKLILLFIVVLAFFLRVYKVDEVPPSLYWDEASLGYNAYSIATTLHDEHGEFLPIQRFIAFGDYKPPGYISAAAASIKLFGLSEFSIRLPSVLAGTLLVVVCYFLVKELGLGKKSAFIASTILAISPWSLQMSRAAFEGNLATLFSGLGILFFLIAVRTKSVPRYLLSSLFFAAAMYTFNSHRVFVPLIITALGLIYLKDILNQKRKLIVFGLALIFLLAPLFPYLTTKESRLRFEEVSWTKDLTPIELSNRRIETDGNTLLAKIIHNRRVIWGQEFLKHYFDHFKADFLFISGDINERLSTRTVGVLYLIELPFLLIGLYFLIKNKSKTAAILFAWLILSPVPAAMARETPHALRFLNVLPVFQIITAVGIGLALKIKYLKFIIPALYLLSFSYYIFDYYNFYPTRSAGYWQYGYKEAVKEVSRLEDQYPCVWVTEDAGRPYIYFLLYNKYPPEKYWANRNVSRDWFGFWTVHNFDKYYFGTNPGTCLKVNYVDNKFIITDL